jgi:hypothetical protein
MIELLIKLLIAHFIGDFLIQPDSWIQDKLEKKIQVQEILRAFADTFAGSDRIP